MIFVWKFETAEAYPYYGFSKIWVFSKCSQNGVIVKYLRDINEKQHLETIFLIEKLIDIDLSELVSSNLYPTWVAHFGALFLPLSFSFFFFLFLFLHYYDWYSLFLPKYIIIFRHKATTNISRHFVKVSLISEKSVSW